MIQNHLNSLGNYLNELCKKYDNFILLGDVNSEMCEDAMLEFSSVYNLKNLYIFAIYVRDFKKSFG